jgi:hypothetical protein
MIPEPLAGLQRGSERIHPGNAPISGMNVSPCNSQPLVARQSSQSHRRRAAPRHTITPTQTGCGRSRWVSSGCPPPPSPRLGAGAGLRWLSEPSQSGSPPPRTAPPQPPARPRGHSARLAPSCVASRSQVPQLPQQRGGHGGGKGWLGAAKRCQGAPPPARALSQGGRGCCKGLLAGRGARGGGSCALVNSRRRPVSLACARLGGGPVAVRQRLRLRQQLKRVYVPRPGRVSGPGPLAPQTAAQRHEPNRGPPGCRSVP